MLDRPGAARRKKGGTGGQGRRNQGDEAMTRPTTRTRRIAGAAGLATALLALAGCGGTDAGNAADADNGEVTLPAPKPGPKLNGVDLNRALTASGAGGWRLAIAPGQIRYWPRSGTATPIELYPVSPQVEGDTARFVTKTSAAEPVTIALRGADCDAGGKPAPLQARVTIGNRELAGCARPDAPAPEATPSATPGAATPAATPATPAKP